jgi:UDP:flavonoid glycosyltransferase YjiC (YdhE family)
VRVPRRLCAPGPVRLAVERVLAAPAMRERAGEFSSWFATHDPAARASELIEGLAG